MMSVGLNMPVITAETNRHLGAAVYMLNVVGI